MELIVATVVVGVLVTLAVTNYTKTLEHAKEKEVIANVYLMYGALRTYKIKHGTYPTTSISETTITAPFDHSNFASLLGVNLATNDLKYEYFYPQQYNDNDKLIVWSPYGWGIHFHSSNWNGSGNCPINNIHCSDYCRDGGTSGVNCHDCPSCSHEDACGCGDITY